MISDLVNAVEACTVTYRKGEPYVEKIRDGFKVVTINTNPLKPEGSVVIDLHFIWVGFTEIVAEYKAHPESFADLVAEAEKGSFADVTLARLREGPSYIELGAWLGSQTLALQFMGLVEFLGLGKVITPATLGVTGAMADTAAGNGYVMCQWTGP